MSFFDDAVSAAKTVGKTVSKRTEEILIISKKKLDAIELESKLTNYYEELGKIYFSILNRNDDEICENIKNQEDIVNNISTTINDLQELRTEIEVLSKNK